MEETKKITLKDVVSLMGDGCCIRVIPIENDEYKYDEFSRFQMYGNLDNTVYPQLAKYWNWTVVSINTDFYKEKDTIAIYIIKEEDENNVI